MAQKKMNNIMLCLFLHKIKNWLFPVEAAIKEIPKTLKDLDYLDSVWIKEDGEIFWGWVFDFTRRCVIVVYGNDLRDFRFRLEKPLDRTEIEQDGKILYCNDPNKEL